ncbi:MAG: hypothetical protein IKN46_01955 [Acholeplasmatales bacterium]|nr:hypothetical protein [Acholeplasmatales bacterium]
MKKKNILLGLLIATGMLSLAGCSKNKPANNIIDTPKTVISTNDESKPVDQTNNEKPVDQTTNEETQKDTTTTTNNEVYYKLSYDNPLDGTQVELKLKDGVVSGLPELDEFTYTNDMFIAKMQFIAFKKVSDNTVIENGDIITEDTEAFCDAYTLDVGFNLNTTEVVDVTSPLNLQYLITFYNRHIRNNRLDTIYIANKNMSELFHNKDDEMVSNKYNKFATQGIYDIGAALSNMSSSDDEYKIYYSKDGIQLELDNQVYFLDLNLNANKQIGDDTEINYYYSTRSLEISKEDFFEMAQNIEYTPWDIARVDALYFYNEEGTSVYSYAIYQNKSSGIEVIKKYNEENHPLVTFENLSFPNLSDILDSFSKEARYYISTDSYIIYDDGIKYIFNLDGTIRRLENSFNEATAVYEFRYEYESNTELEEITFGDFLAEAVNDIDLKHFIVDYDASQITDYFEAAFIRGNDYASLIDGNDAFMDVPFISSSLYGSYGILEYLNSNVGIENVKFYKNNVGYYAVYEEDDNIYTLSFDKLGYLVGLDTKDSLGNFIDAFYFNNTQEEYGEVYISDEKYDEIIHSYSVIGESLDTKPCEFGKLDSNNNPKWYTKIGYSFFETEEAATVIMPGTNYIKVNYDVTDAVKIDVYNNLDSENVFRTLIIKKGDKLFDENGNPIYRSPYIHGYTFEGYYGNPNCTIPLVTTTQYNKNATIYLKYNLNTYYNYTIVGTGTAGMHIGTVKTSGPNEVVTTNLGCIRASGNINPVVTADKVKTTIAKGSTIEFNVASNATISVVLANTITTPIAVYRKTYSTPPTFMFNNGFVYMRVNGEFVQMHGAKDNTEYYIVDQLTVETISKDTNKFSVSPQLETEIIIEFLGDADFIGLSIEYPTE